MKLYKKSSRLFSIIIAVAMTLFALPSYAVPKPSKVLGQPDSGFNIQASTIIRSALVKKTSIMRMTIAGVLPEDLEFNPPIRTLNVLNGSNAVFHYDGGGAMFGLSDGKAMVSESPSGWIYNGENEVEHIARMVEECRP